MDSGESARFLPYLALVIINDSDRTSICDERFQTPTKPIGPTGGPNSAPPKNIAPR
jgi:hypothetical protein